MGFVCKSEHSPVRRGIAIGIDKIILRQVEFPMDPRGLLIETAIEAFKVTGHLAIAITDLGADELQIYILAPRL